MLKISVLTPSFNSHGYIEKAIESVLSQGDPCFEHIIVDGGSTDGTVEILKRYSHLKWVSEKDRGQSDAMNKAFDMSTGDIIVYLNADDYFFDDIFREVRNKFENNECDVVLGNVEIIYPDNHKMVNIPSLCLKEILHPQYFQFPFNPVGYFYKRKIQELIGKFPESNHYSMDYWFILRMYKISKILKIDKEFGAFLNHEFNKTSQSEKNTTFIVALNFIILHYRSYLFIFLIKEGYRGVKYLRHLMKKSVMKIFRI